MFGCGTIAKYLFACDPQFSIEMKSEKKLRLNVVPDSHLLFTEPSLEEKKIVFSPNSFIELGK